MPASGGNNCFFIESIANPVINDDSTICSKLGKFAVTDNAQDNINAVVEDRMPPALRQATLNGNSPCKTTLTPGLARSSTGAVAFAFDIDGVLVNGTKAIPGAQETLAMLQRNKIPFIFLTNSGGLTEKANLEKLALRLCNISFEENQIVQSHTPFRSLVNMYRGKTILALGGHGENIRKLAYDYGFEHVVTSSDIMASSEHVHPFPEMTKEHHNQHGKKWTRDDALQVSAILIWASPRDWCLDLQVILDLLLSVEGIVGTRSAKNGDSMLPNYGYLQDGQPKLYFCNPDFEFSTQHRHPRLAQGAFREALRGLWGSTTKWSAQLQDTVCGKPTETTYLYGEQTLRDYYAANPGPLGENIKTVYMVGDNPESDIAGANAYKSRYGSRWRSVLVETGVHATGSVPVHAPDHVAQNVKEGVEWALAAEGIVLE